MRSLHLSDDVYNHTKSQCAEHKSDWETYKHKTYGLQSVLVKYNAPVGTDQVCFQYLDIYIFLPTLYMFGPLSTFNNGQFRDQAFWSQGMLGIRAFGAAVKWNRLNHAVKQVFTGLHYNVIFSPLPSSSIRLYVSQRKPWFLQADDIWSAGEGGEAWRLDTYCTSGNSVSGEEPYQIPESCPFIRLKR